MRRTPELEDPPINPITRRIIAGLVGAAVLAAVVFGVLAWFSDWPAMREALRSFPLSALVWMTGLTLVGFVVRGWRWRYLTRLASAVPADHAGADMRLRDAMYVQFSGLPMTVTPGKLGEALKAYLNRELVGQPLSVGLTLVVTERLADLIAVVVLSAGSFAIIGGALPAFIAMTISVVVVVAALSSHAVHERLLALVERRVVERCEADPDADAAPCADQAPTGTPRRVSETLRLALKPGPLAVSVSVSAVAWGLEGVALVVCLRSIGSALPAAGDAIAAYAASTILGALTFLPGGIGLTELSLVGLLVAGGASRADASTATLLVRLVTLWFGVALGWIVFATRPAVLRSMLAELAGARSTTETEPEPDR